MSSTGLERVSVVRGGRTVLHDVTLRAGDGELLVVLGPSGSGKTTLLRVLGGLDDVTSGDVVIRGRRVTDDPAPRRRAAMVFEASALVPFLDVARNLGFGLRLQGVPEEDVERRVGGQSRKLRLSRLLSRRPAALSGGERGLVGIGHALVQSPDVFLLDEPLGMLDAAQRPVVRRQITELVQALGVPAFYVTHDQAEALAVADRMALLHEGEVRQVGAPMELYHHPVDRVVAEFVGAVPMGMLPARLVSADGRGGFAVGPRTLPLWRPVPEPLRDHVGRDVVLGLRAEDVHPAGAADADAVTLDAVVTDVEYTGGRTVVSLVVSTPVTADEGGLGPPAEAGTAMLHALYPARTGASPGDLLRIAVDATRAHVFDADTGRALWHPRDDGPASPACGTCA